MSWNHRVIMEREANGEPHFAIHEVYYNKDGEACSWTANPVCVHGDNLKDLKWTLKQMKRALKDTVLEAVDDQLVELKEIPK